MDWDSAKQHCNERNWQWSLELINQAQKEMEDLETKLKKCEDQQKACLLYTSPSPRDATLSRMPSSA